MPLPCSAYWIWSALRKALLNRRPAGQRPQSSHMTVISGQLLPKLLGAPRGEGVLDMDRAPQAYHVGRLVGTGDPVPAALVGPAVAQECGRPLARVDLSHLVPS